MKKTLAALIVFSGIALLGLPAACYYENEEDLYGSSTCITANMRFSVEIKQILQAQCDECHVSTSASYSGIPIETYAEMKEIADNGKLVGRINDQGAPMPQTGLMDKCSRQKIEAWVTDGAPDN